MAFSIKYNEHKDQILKATRDVSFDEAIASLKSGGLLEDKEHPSRTGRRIYIIKIDEYVYIMPHVINYQSKEIFLKTIYPSRKFTKLYIKKGGYNGK